MIDLVGQNFVRCLRKEGSHRTHGLRKNPFYQVIYDAYHRCNNKYHRQYPDYGARGIEFKFGGHSFEEALVSAIPHYEKLGSKPPSFISPISGKIVEYSIDRIDNEGHYEPGNLRWATPAEQVGNRREVKKKKNSKSKYKGVRWFKKNKKWGAYKDGKYLGLFSTEEEAYVVVK